MLNALSANINSSIHEVPIKTREEVIKYLENKIIEASKKGKYFVILRTSDVIGVSSYKERSKSHKVIANYILMHKDFQEYLVGEGYTVTRYFYKNSGFFHLHTLMPVKEPKIMIFVERVEISWKGSSQGIVNVAQKEKDRW